MFSALSIIAGIVSLIAFGLPLLKALAEVKDNKKRLEEYRKLKNQFPLNRVSCGQSNSRPEPNKEAD